MKKRYRKEPLGDTFGTLRPTSTAQSCDKPAHRSHYNPDTESTMILRAEVPKHCKTCFRGVQAGIRRRGRGNFWQRRKTTIWRRNTRFDLGFSYFSEMLGGGGVVLNLSFGSTYMGCLQKRVNDVGIHVTSLLCGLDYKTMVMRSFFNSIRRPRPRTHQVVSAICLLLFYRISWFRFAAKQGLQATASAPIE